MKNVILSGLLLAVFAVVGTGLVAYTFDNTREQIAANQREALLRSLHAIIPPERHDNDLFADTIQVTDRQLLGSRDPVTVYRARKNGRPVAAALTATAPAGYGGAIELLVAIRYDGTVAGVRVIDHRETPGLGDGIEIEKSDWISGFDGRSLEDPPAARWRVKKDGGEFDQFTGATIPPRAVVTAVRNALIYFRTHRRELFERQREPAPALEAPAAGAPASIPDGDADSPGTD